MKKLLFILTILLTLSTLSFGQDNKPTGRTTLIAPNNPTFDYSTADSTIGIWKGAYKWNKLFSAKQIQHKIDSLANATTDTLDYYKLKSDSLAPYGYTRRDRLASELAKKENTLTKGNLTAGSTKISVNGGTGSVIGSGTSIDVNEGNLTLSNIGGSVTDTQVPNTITLDNITQITNRSHTNLNDIGTNTHTQIDNHISSTSNPHITKTLHITHKIRIRLAPLS